ncbi:MAG: dioxygenase [Asticcacaulis sp.]|uniref:DODA-type extradiol aromatic ring-opening family dioxygenase n=1 Tax=Asticcacaulis sp. TaxID=1872648 RepID=UPI0025C48705|nr:class III extradiol ring-cleavage dioxygenase [Asticcacaulis sp.]MCA1935264.1 dioxygenase [Asticcacaulis sp.]
MTSQHPLPTLYIPHGGGPCFFMEWNPPHLWDRMGDYLRDIPRQVGQRPKAILVISAHWMTERFTVQTKAKPGMLFDYYGFPDHTYRLNYPAPGSPELAERVIALAAEAGIPVDRDAKRDYDHGVFVPFLLMYPEADIPVVQLSIKSNWDPQQHIALGKALAPLRDEGVLIVASGMSFHDLKALIRLSLAHEPVNGSHYFNDWLNDTLTAHTGEAREALLRDWSKGAGARIAHPHEDHLVPLFVAAGAASDAKAVRTYDETLRPMNTAVSGFQFG